MKPMLLIGHNDLRLFLRSRLAWVWLFVVPLVFVYFMGFANRGPGDPANPRPAVSVENLDPGFLGRLFLDELGVQGLTVVAPTNGENAPRRLRVPADFTARVLGGEQARIELSEASGSAAGKAAMVELRVLRAVLALNSHLLEVVTGHGEAALGEEAAWQAVRRQENPVRLEARFAGRKPVPTGFNFSLPGNLVMYLLMNLTVFGGAALAAERRSGVLRRHAVHAVGRSALVLGKLYGLLLLAAVQSAFFLAVGRWVFGVPLGANLPAVSVTLLAFAWVAAALGVLAGSAIQQEERVVGVCVLGSLLLAALGGCWWPLEVAPQWLQVFAHLLPTGWALEALHPLISFGAGWEAAARPLGVLAGFGVVITALAARAFRV